MPIEGIVLQMKSMNIDQVINFPFPTPPDRAALQKAERTLVHLGALTAAMTSGKAVTSPARITELGNAMSLFPLSPRFAKMLVVGQQHGCLPYVIAVVSALSAGDPFLRAEGLGLTAGGDEEADIQGEDGEGAELQHIRSEKVKEREVRKLQRKKFYAAQQRHAALGKSTSDVLKMLGVVGAYDYDGGSAKFCEDNFVRVKVRFTHHISLAVD
jgi:ATP-dependent RNA helicase DHX37/DHR1